jgi:hypothetical protein
MKACVFAALGVIGLAVVGCGSGTIPAGGTITYKGQPVADANVTFTPDGGGKMASGRTDAQGKFTLGTDKPGDGAMPGDYRVSVTPNLPTPAEGDYSPSPPPPFPQKYVDPSVTDLKATVKSGANNQFPFELKD